MIGVELGAADLIAGLMPEPAHPERPRARGERKRAGFRCPNHQCGVCVGCQDDARWEAIYNAKFKNPDYYKLHVRIRSSLSNVMFPVVNADLQDRPGSRRKYFEADPEPEIYELPNWDLPGRKKHRRQAV